MLVLDIGYIDGLGHNAIKRGITCYSFDFKDNTLFIYLSPMDSFRRKPNSIVLNVERIEGIGIE